MNQQNSKAGADEFTESLRRILGEHITLKMFRYFVNQALQWYRKVRNGQPGSRVVILGTGIPEELVMAAGETPFHILGGSHESCEWSDDLVPRDTDPVSRSVLGYVQCLKGKGLLYILSAGNDSMRKIAYQLIRDGEKVFVVDAPPVREDEFSRRKWSDQIFRMMEEVMIHTKGKVSAASLRRAVRTASDARTCLKAFLMMAPEYDRILSPSARILIQNSYYYAEDPEIWTEKLRDLMKEIRLRARKMDMVHQSEHGTDPGRDHLRQHGSHSDAPRVLLTGSPVYFPNDKLPRLLTEAGLRIWRQADASEQIRYIIPGFGKDTRNLRKMVQKVAMAWYRMDASSACLKNEVMRKRIVSLCSTQKIEGVVFHVLKGQIEQDFELAYYEDVLETYKIPVFRLETDYQYQDVEQLRIRMEAFAEMLKQNRCREQDIRYQSRTRGRTENTREKEAV